MIKPILSYEPHLKYRQLAATYMEEGDLMLIKTSSWSPYAYLCVYVGLHECGYRFLFFDKHDVEVLARDVYGAKLTEIRDAHDV